MIQIWLLLTHLKEKFIKMIIKKYKKLIIYLNNIKTFSRILKIGKFKMIKVAREVNLSCKVVSK
jgi:hypothetical protein